MRPTIDILNDVLSFMNDLQYDLKQIDSVLPYNVLDTEDYPDIAMLRAAEDITNNIQRLTELEVELEKLVDRFVAREERKKQSTGIKKIKIRLKSANRV